MCGSEIAQAELPQLRKTWVTELCQPFMPVPYLAAQLRLTLAFFIQPGFCNAVNLTQAFVEFDSGWMRHAPAQFGQYGVW